jgi:DNA-binding transcriptional MerR regulator
MTYEEKRELRLQISQLLADAGLNQYKIKEMVEAEIQNKVERAVNQVIKSLNAETSSGDYIREETRKMLNYNLSYGVSQSIKDELSKRVIHVELRDVVVDKN